MKNAISLILLFTVFCCSTLPAQFEVRLLGGINSSTYTSDFQDAEFRSGWGYQFGVDVLMGDSWFFQPGLQLEFLNNPVNDIDLSNGTDDIIVNRLRIPVYIGHRFLEKGSSINARLFGGVNGAIVVNKSIAESLDFEETDMSDFTYGITVGGGLDFLFLFLDVGYMFGMNDVFKDAEDSPHNNLFFANVGIRF